MYQRTVLPNGIRIVTEYMPFLRSVTLGAWFEVGSRHEQPQEWGLSHFIEHMMFKGTEKYTARQIAEIMDEHGGYINAFTGKEHTCYYFKVLDEHFSVASEVLQQMLLHSLFLPEEIAKERNVVLEELNMYEDSPEELVHDLFATVLWPDHPLGNSIIGSASTIRNFDQQMILSFLREHYTTDRLVIASAGNIPHERVVEEFASVFRDLPRGQAPLIQQPLSQGGSGVFQDKDTEQIHLCLGGTSLGRTDQNKYAIYLLDTIIGGGVSSLLFQELREERGLVYNTYSFSSLYKDVGAYGIYAGFSPHHWNEVWDVICTQFASLPRILTEDVLTRAKGQLTGSILLSLESTSNRMTRLAKGELDEGRIVTVEEILSRIGTVDHNELLKVGNKVYDPQEWSWVGLGPKDAVKEDILCRKIC